MASMIPPFIDERREWLRVDDRLLLDYRVIGEAGGYGPPAADEALDAAITTFITKPTVDLLSHGHPTEAVSLLVPWLKKIDWVLEVVLQQLAHRNPGGMTLPRLTQVNLSGGGISFPASRPLEQGSELSIRLILPPFTAIESRAEVTRVDPADAEGRWWVGARFVGMQQDDHEHLIRHILHVQAERLRTRHLGVGVSGS
ncbi:PilZ domain-containing protein [Candidatus Nitrospira bockiana]